MSSSTSPSAATKAHQFSKLLNQKPGSSSRIRTPEDAEEALKKLGRLILVNGIPSEVVSTDLFQTRNKTSVPTASIIGSNDTPKAVEATFTRE